MDGFTFLGIMILLLQISLGFGLNEIVRAIRDSKFVMPKEININTPKGK